MSDRQDKLLAEHDGRYFAIDKYNTGIAMLVKAEKIGKKSQVDFGLPSGPALFLNLARKSYNSIKGLNPLTMFYKWQNGIVPINNSQLFNYFENFISHVVFSFTAIEAFTNEAIPREYKFSNSKNGQTKILSKAEIERSINLDTKLHLVLPDALCISSPKGKKLWQNYRQLKKIRDRIIHLKTVDRSPSSSDIESVWGIMLRSHVEPYCDYAHKLMGHFKPAVNRRWFNEYPYETVESDYQFK